MGGVSALLNTGFDDQMDKFGTTPPIGASFEYEKLALKPEEQMIVEKLKKAKIEGKKIVVAYPGSNQETEARNFIQIYLQTLIKERDVRENSEIVVIVPGDVLHEIESLSTVNLQIIQTGKIRNSFLSHLLSKYVSRNLPSLVAGSMSAAEAMYYGVPFFYKAELWKKGNTDFLRKTIEQAGLAPQEIEGARSLGVLKGLDMEGAPVNILKFDSENEVQMQQFGEQLQAVAKKSFDKLPESIFSWYGLLKRIREKNNPTEFKQKLKQQKGNKVLPAFLPN